MSEEKFVEEVVEEVTDVEVIEAEADTEKWYHKVGRGVKTVVTSKPMKIVGYVAASVGGAALGLALAGKGSGNDNGVDVETADANDFFGSLDSEI